MTNIALRREIKKVVDRLPPERLESLADYVYFLNRPPLTRRLEAADKAIASGRVFLGARFGRMFEVILSPDAETFYAGADRPLARKLARCFAQLEQDPRHSNNIKRLSGELAGKIRYRIGDWRVMYRIDEEKRRVLILTIAHRREIYE